MPTLEKAAGITIERPTRKRLKELNVETWPVWTKAPSQFPWEYVEKEMCYFVEGEATVKTHEGEVSLKQGDFVTFPLGLKCVWTIKQAVRKHYFFD